MVEVHFEDEETAANLHMTVEDYDLFLQIVAQALLYAFPAEQQTKTFLRNLDDALQERSKGKPSLEQLQLYEDFGHCLDYFASQRRQRKSQP